jgi:hypothetical protein
MCNLYNITTNQAAIIALFRVVNRYVGNLPPMPGVFSDYPEQPIAFQRLSLLFALVGSCFLSAFQGRAFLLLST